MIANIDNDKVKRQFVNSIIEISSTTGCHVIAEGVETQEEYATARKLGAGFAQGYYFAKPSSEPEQSINGELFRNPHQRPVINRKNSVARLLKPMASVDSSTCVEEAAEIFMRDPDIQTVAVLLDQQAIGLLIRSRFMNMYAHRFGRDLYGKKPVYQFVEKNILCFEASTPLDVVSKRLTNALDVHPDEFLLSENGKFLGKGTLLDLLKAITQQQIEMARYANPLTLLPGNVPIMQEIRQRLQAEQAFTAVYCDLDNFKPYNDCYGYSKGDEVILTVGRLLREHCHDVTDFVGHIGGDDFLLLLDWDNWEATCQRIVSAFNEAIALHYNLEDRRNGCFMAMDRHNQERCFPLISISLGAVPVNAVDFPQTLDTINAAATAAKSAAKKTKGSSISIIAPESASKYLIPEDPDFHPLPARAC